MTINKNKVKGFTLLELLIVIAILAILSVALVLILNPAETMKKGRDSQRMNDMAAMKTALGLYLTTVQQPKLGGTTGNNTCKGDDTLDTWIVDEDSIFYSLNDTTPITDLTLDGTTFTAGDGPAQATASQNSTVSGDGWIPVNFNQIVGGSPISNLPIDPVNTITDLSAVANTDLVYRYVCDADNLTFEINAILESAEFASKMTTDGGNNANYYEVGTKMDILGAGTDF